MHSGCCNNEFPLRLLEIRRDEEDCPRRRRFGSASRREPATLATPVPPDASRWLFAPARTQATAVARADDISGIEG
jgi:hypothetical protein